MSSQDEQIIERLSPPVRRVPAGQDILHEGDDAGFITLIVEGWACRYRQLENGRRQIIAFFLPGDLCEPYGILPHFLDHSLSALTPVALMQFSPETLRAAARASERLDQALWWDMLVAAAIQRESTVSLGQRLASQRLGHLFCEFHLRLGCLGMTDDASFALPITQAELGDALGLTSVHINRSLKDLRERGLCSLKSRRLIIHDVERLRRVSLFDPNYLHLDHNNEN